MEKKRKIAIGIMVVVLVALAGVGIFLARKNGRDQSNLAYVEKISSMMGDTAGKLNRFAGVVEAQDTWKINLSEGKEVKEIFVKAGDEVAEGDQLFAYNTDEVDSQIEQAKLELESINNDISDAKEQIAELSAERDAAVSEETKFDYSTQIQSVQNELKQSEYDLKSKRLEIDKFNETISGSVVTSKMAGVVKSINDPNNPSEDSGEGAFMTILASGSYRVKCYVNEQNMSQIEEGAPMLIRSRVDEKQTWKGTLAGIDVEAPQSNSGSEEYMEESSDSDTTTSSKYPFYIAMEDTKGMMLGQHVFVEMDYGQSSEKKGVWIYESYLVQEEEGAYVWADNGKGKLEKRTVEVGKYDEELGEYEIKSGLKKNDYIAWPQEGLEEGMGTTKDASRAMETTEEDGKKDEDTNEDQDENTEDDGELLMPDKAGETMKTLENLEGEE